MDLALREARRDRPHQDGYRFAPPSYVLTTISPAASILAADHAVVFDTVVRNGRAAAGERRCRCSRREQCAGPSANNALVHAELALLLRHNRERPIVPRQSPDFSQLWNRPSAEYG